MNITPARLHMTEAERRAMQRRFENSRIVTAVLLSPWNQGAKPQPAIVVCWGKTRAFFSRLFAKQADLNRLDTLF
jgi:hypothetical protein